MYIILLIKTIFIILFYNFYKEKINLKNLIILFLVGDLITLITIKTNYLKLIIISLLCVLIYYMFNKYNKISREYTIIKDGKINFQELINSKYELSKLISKLKDFNLTVEEVSIATIRNNELFINKYENPYPLIINGVVNYNNLLKINKTKQWLDKFLNNKNLNKEDIFYAFHLENKTFIITK